MNSLQRLKSLVPIIVPAIPFAAWIVLLIWTYVNVRPGKRQLVFLGMPIHPAIKGMRDAFELFAGKHIQNNYSESTNNVLRTVVFLGGQRSVPRLNGRIRAVMRMRNDPGLKLQFRTKHRYRANLYLKRMAGGDFRTDFSNYSTELQAKA